MSPYELNVLIPDRWGGLSVASVGDLYDRLNDEEDVEEAITNACFDTTPSIGPSGEELVRIVRRVDALNRTQDANAYWDTEGDE